MSDEHLADRLALVTRAIRATMLGDSSVVADLFTADVHAVMPARAWSAESLAVEIEDRTDVFAEVVVDATAAHCVDDEIWVEWRAAVTHTGPFAIAEHVIPPSGRNVDLTGVTIAAFDDDLIASFRQYWDSGALIEASEGLVDPQPETT